MTQGRLPPLTALRAFGAAARHMSFAKAADELSVTPAALSFQIKSLEEHLGQPLFRRLNRAVELTEAGALLAPAVQDGFERLISGWRAVQRLQDTRTLTVTAGPAFTAKFLAPRLFAFAQEHPEIELRFAATLRQLDFDRDEVDVAIRFGYGPDEGLFSRPLMRDCATPVMTPGMAERYRTPEDLATAPLIYDDSINFLDPPMNWPVWFRVAGLDSAPPPGTHFSQADHAIDAAQAGVGVLLARTALAAPMLADGRLVAPFNLSLSSKAHFRFICPLGAETRPAIAAFREWLEREAAKFSHVNAGKTVVTVEDLAKAG